MFMPYQKPDGKRLTSSRDWESNIDRVVLEECAPGEDPLGYRATFFMQEHEVEETTRKSFSVGASFLGQRARNLESAGYKASMTRQALDLLEKQLAII